MMWMPSKSSLYTVEWNMGLPFWCTCVLVISNTIRGGLAGQNDVHEEEDIITFHVEKTAMKDGFHRDLRIDIRSEDAVAVEGCVVLAKQLIPADAFVDPYQMQELKRSGGPDVLVPMDVDVEKPFESSAPTSAFIYVNKGSNAVGRRYTYSASFPVHVRYHSPGDGFASFTIPKTDVLLRCNTRKAWKSYVEAPCNGANRSQCRWFKASVQEPDPVTITVPVGIEEHARIVTSVTLLVTAAGCVYLLRVIVRHGVVRKNCSKEN